MMGGAVWFVEYVADISCVALSAAMVGTYYLWLRSKTRRDPTYSVHGVNQLARTLWVANVMRNPSKDVMAVQTLRNFIMGASLMASTATLFIIGTLTLSGQADSVSRSWHALKIFGMQSADLWIFKVLCLLADFIIAFFAFAMSVRLSNHVLFMINVPEPETLHPNLCPDAVARRLTRAGNLFAIGMRAFFFAVPIVFWLFGPTFLVLATVGLVIGLRRLDMSEPA